MKSYLSLVRRYLKHQGRRTCLTVIGIVLAVALITSVGVIAESIQNTLIEQAIELNGTYHAQLKKLSDEQLSVLKNHLKLDCVGEKRYLGGYTHPYKMFDMILEGWDQTTACDIFRLTLASGRFPQNDGEIVLEEWALEQLGLEPMLGQKVNLDFTNTLLVSEQSKLMSHEGSAEFTLVGVLENIIATKATGQALGLVTPETVSQLLPPEHRVKNAFVRVKEGLPIRETLLQIQNSLGLTNDDIHINTTLLNVLGEREKTNWPVVVLAAIIVVATVAAVYNIFRISVLERIRQFGMLRCIGATPKQIRLLVLGEALLLGLIGIPLGLAVGYALAAGLASGISLLQGVISQIVISAKIVVLATVLGLISMLLAVLSPARLAGKVSPLQATRSHSGVLTNSNSRVSRLHKLIAKAFGITGIMAYRNLWRNRKRTLVTLVSMCLAVTLFIVFSYFVSSADTSNVLEDYVKSDYALMTDHTVSEVGYAPAIIEHIRSLPGVTEVIPTHKRFGSLLMTDSEAVQHYREVYASHGIKLEKDKETDRYAIGSSIYSYPENILESCIDLLVAGAIDIDQLNNEHAVLVAKGHGDIDDEISVGDSILMMLAFREDDSITYQRYELKVAGILADVPLSAGNEAIGPRIIMHEKLWKQLTGIDAFRRVDILVGEDTDKTVLEARLNTLADQAPRGTLVSYEEQRAELEKEKRQVAVLFYGIIGVIALIGLLNIVNTINTNLILRVREFGTMRAVGMTVEQLKKMIQMEGLFYGIISSLWGTLLGSVIAYVLYPLLKEQSGYLEWSVPWVALVLGWIGSIGIGLLATVIPMGRIVRMNIVESTRAID